MKAHSQPTIPTLSNPFAEEQEIEFTIPNQLTYEPGLYESTLRSAHDFLDRPRAAAGALNIEKQHLNKRMTIWERIEVLAERETEPTILFHNRGLSLDGASLVIGSIKINVRDVAN